MDLSCSKSTEACFHVFQRSVEQLGFDSVAYSSIPIQLSIINHPPPTFLASSTFNGNFLTHYSEAGLDKHDFTIKRILEGDTSIASWRHEELNERLLQNEAKLVQLAREDYGIKNALSIPTLSSKHHISGVSVTSEESDKNFKFLIDERGETLQAITRIFHDRVYSNIDFRKYFYSDLINSLTSDEKKVLSFIASGKPLKLSKEVCGISQSYAGNIRSSLFYKFQVNNAAELIFLISNHRILEMI